MHRNIPVRLTPTTRSHSSFAMSAADVPGCSPPALLQATSSRPNAWTVSSSAHPHIVFAGDVAGEGEVPSACFLDEPCGLLEAVRGRVGEGDAGAGDGGGAADAGAGSGHEGRLPGEARAAHSHVRSPLARWYVVGSTRTQA